MDDRQTLHAMGLDDAYRVEAVLADGVDGTTELVSLDGAGPFVRKRIPLRLARRRLWSALAECRSTRLPRVEATYELPDRFVVVYDYVDGITLERYVGEHGGRVTRDGLRRGLDAAEAVRIAVQLCEAVGELHAHGVIHRDISPGNVVIAADGAHLIDFGIARERPAGADANGKGPVRSRDTTTLGTWGFAAPEQYGFAPTDARTDVYALGRLLGYMLTGVHPADGSYDAALASADAPSAVKAVIAKACAFEPSARMRDVDELRRDLERGGVDATTHPRPRHRPAADGGRPRAVAWIAAGTAALLIASGAGYAGYVALGHRNESPDVAVSSRALTDTGGGTGGGSGNDDAQGGASGTDVTAGNPLELVEHGWSAEAGYVQYAVAVRNTDADRGVRFPKVTVTGRDKDGSVLFSETHVMSIVYPGQTMYDGGQCGDGTPPADVEFAVEAPEDGDLIDTEGAETYAVTGARERRLEPGGVTFSGEVVTERDDDNGKGVYASDVVVSLVLRDASGAIVFGRDTNVGKPAKGAGRAFSIEIYGPPDYASYELYAHTG